MIIFYNCAYDKSEYLFYFKSFCCIILSGDTMDTWIQYLLIILALIVISLIVVKLMKKDFHMEANKLVNYLGGKDNIMNAECNMSRFKVILKDVSIVDKDAIEKLGAKGIVEIDNQLKIIFGKDAKQLKKYIDEIM